MNFSRGETHSKKLGCKTFFSMSEHENNNNDDNNGFLQVIALRFF